MGSPSQPIEDRQRLESLKVLYLDLPKLANKLFPGEYICSAHLLSAHCNLCGELNFQKGTDLDKLNHNSLQLICRGYQKERAANTCSRL